MTTGFNNMSRFMVGKETVTLHVRDSDEGVEVENALCGPVTREQMQTLATLGVETDTLRIKLDAADLGDVAPARGSRIDRGDETQWRVKDLQYTHVSEVYDCACSKLK